MPSVATKIKPFESLAWDGNLQQVINRDASSPYPTLTNTPQLRIQNTNRKQFRIAYGPYCFLIILVSKTFLLFTAPSHSTYISAGMRLWSLQIKFLD